MPLTNPALVLTLTAAVPAIGAVIGDRILVRPGHRHPLVLQRDLDDDAAPIIAALDLCEFELTSPHGPDATLETLRAVVGDPLPQSFRPSPRPRRLRLS